MAFAGATYIGEHHLDNISIINGARVETFDNVFTYNTLNVTGGILQAANNYLAGSVQQGSPLIRKAAFRPHPKAPVLSPSKPASVATKKTRHLSPDTSHSIKARSLPPQLANKTPKGETLAKAGNRISHLPLSIFHLPSSLPRPSSFVNRQSKSPSSLVTGHSIKARSLPPQIAKETPKGQTVAQAGKEVLPLPFAISHPPSAITGPSIKLASLSQRLHVSAVPSTSVDSVRSSLSHPPSAISHSSGATPSVDPTYTYDIKGNKTSMITPYGTWTYAYDIVNRLTSITNQSGEITSFTYDILGRRTSVAYANGVTTTYTYDAGSRLTGLVTAKGATTISSYTYTYDKVGNRLSMTDNSGTHNYTYDLQYRLISATHPQPTNPDETFTYDPVGNRLSSQKSASYGYDNLNRLLEDDQFTYTYDNNGNLTSKNDKISGGNTTSQYDGENRLVRVTTPTDVVEYRYDGFGRRIGKTVNGVITNYVYDGEDILFETDGAGSIKAKYTYGPGIDEPISVERDTNGDGTLDATYFYQYDGLGSVIGLTDSLGNTVQTYEYDSFGNIVQQTGAIPNNYTYTAREWDEKAGLYFYRARYYDAQIGRFISEDPIGFDGGVNFFIYTFNNPINFTDPLGLISCKGSWRMAGWDRIALTVCFCYWLCMPCESPTIWSGNYRKLPSTVGTVAGSARGGIESGSSCSCRPPGPETGCCTK